MCRSVKSSSETLLPVLRHRKGEGLWIRAIPCPDKTKPKLTEVKVCSGNRFNTQMTH